MSVTMRALDRAQSRIPQPWRTILDWVVTIAVAIAFVLAFQAAVAKPYRIPSSSMERTLHCAKPGDFCEGRFDDRVIANRLAYRFGDPERGQIVVFKAPAKAERCESGAGGSALSSASSDFPASWSRSETAPSTSTASASSSPTSIHRRGDTGPTAGRELHRATTSSLAITARTPATPARGERCPEGA